MNFQEFEEIYLLEIKIRYVNQKKLLKIKF